MHIDAPAERIYDLVTDVSQMGRWSPECTGGRWLGGATSPEVGARFKGRNKRGLMRWSTKCEVTKADRPSALEWQVAESGMQRSGPLGRDRETLERLEAAAEPS